MRFVDLLKRSARNLKESKVRTILTALAIAVGAVTINLAMAASNGANSYIDFIIKSNFDPTQLIVYKEKPKIGGIESTGPQQYNPDATSLRGGNELVQLNRDDIDKLKSMNGVESVGYYFMLSPKYVTAADGSTKYTASVTSKDNYLVPELVSGSSENLQDGQVILPASYLDKLNLGTAEQAIGKTVDFVFDKKIDATSQSSLQFAFSNKPTEFTYKLEIVAVAKSEGLSSNRPNITYISQNQAKKIDDDINQGTSSEGKLLAVTVQVKDGADQTKLNTTKNALNEAGFYAQTASEAFSIITNFVNILQFIVIGFGVITIFASIFGIINTQYISVLERTKEIGLMKALGMRSIDVLTMFTLEAAWIGFLGGAIGGVLAWVITLGMNPQIEASLSLGRDLLIYNFSQAAALTGVLLLVAVLAGILPAIKASKLDPIEALRTE